MEGEPTSKGPGAADDALVIDLLDPPDAMPQAFETPRDAHDRAGAGSDGQAPHLAMTPALGPNDVVPPEKVKTETGRETQKSPDPQKDVVSVIDLFDPAAVTTPSLESPEDGRDDGAEGEDGRPGPVPAHSKAEPSGRSRNELYRGEPSRSRKGGVRQNSRSPGKRQLNPLSPRSTVPGRLPLITQPGPRAAIPPAPVVDKAVGADIQGDEIQHKYAEVVRNKSAREALLAFECPDCAAFYDALESWGHAPGTVPPCGHAKPQGGAVQNPGQPSRQGMQASTRLLCQKGSRHRFRFPPPPTPDGFWDLGFNDSEQCN